MMKLKTSPLPLAVTVSHSRDWQLGHIGRGGCRSLPHEVQCWIRSSPRSTPSQKKALSWLRGGFGRGGFSSSFSGGRKLRMRKRMLLTTSAVWTGLVSPTASHQCRIIAWLTASHALNGGPDGRPTNPRNLSRNASSSDIERVLL